MVSQIFTFFETWYLFPDVNISVLDVFVTFAFFSSLLDLYERVVNVPQGAIRQGDRPRSSGDDGDDGDDGEHYVPGAPEGWKGEWRY